MTSGIIVQVKAETVIGEEPIFSFWVVATDNPEKALAVVRQRVAPECKVEVANAKAQPEMMNRLRLSPDQAHLI